MVFQTLSFIETFSKVSIKDKITIKRVKTSDGKVKFRRLKAPDFATRFKFLEMAFKLKGYFDNPPGQSGDLNKFLQEAEYIANKKENSL